MDKNFIQSFDFSIIGTTFGRINSDYRRFNVFQENAASPFDLRLETLLFMV
jgi:hypothetical protein